MLNKNDLKEIERLLKRVSLTKEEGKNFATKKDIEDAIEDATSQILEAVDRGFSETASKDDIQGHEKRISKLEQAVFPS